MDWTVYVEAHAPEGAAPLAHEAEALDRFAKRILAVHGAASGDSTGWTAYLTIADKVRAGDAAAAGELTAREAAMEAGYPASWVVVRLEATEVSLSDAEVHLDPRFGRRR